MRHALIFISGLAIAACGGGSGTVAPPVPETVTDTTKIPLTDMSSSDRYLGFSGGL